MSKPLLGFDTQGQVFELEQTVYRRIREEYKPVVTELYRSYLRDKLDQHGIVETTLTDDGHLEHKKLIISYPYEWPASMYQDAVLFHLRLFLELAKAGLTLKDALPNNILFDCTTPVHVDFLSLVFASDLRKEAWLGAERDQNPRLAVIDKMLLPYLVLPMIFMSRGDYRHARNLLSSRSCNCSEKAPRWLELLIPGSIRNMRAFRAYLRSLVLGRQILQARRQCSDIDASIDDFIGGLLPLLAAADVSPCASGYATYYAEKNEANTPQDPALLQPKQLAVYQVLTEKQPKSVLDIGANTGWYSILASSLGASVIALEQDESCADILYQTAKRRKLNILPLTTSFTALDREMFSMALSVPAFEVTDFVRIPLYRSGIERFRSDLVLALGLAHHLVLGEGQRIESIFETLASLTQKTLVLEYIDLDDEKISGSPAFFPNLNQFDRDSYHLDRFITCGRQFFSSVKTLPSNPSSRVLLVFDK